MGIHQWGSSLLQLTRKATGYRYTITRGNKTTAVFFANVAPLDGILLDDVGIDISEVEKTIFVPAEVYDVFVDREPQTGDILTEKDHGDKKWSTLPTSSKASSRVHDTDRKSFQLFLKQES